MKKIGILAVVVMVACSGCTTVSLSTYTESQNQSCGEARDRTVLNCLAAVAANPVNLPSYSLYSNGITSVTDSVTLGLTTTSAPLKYTLNALGVTASTAPKGQWTFDPTAEYEQLKAVHAACLWALCGQERAHNAYPGGVLGDPTIYLDGKAHFNVERRLVKIPSQWIHYGCWKDMPVCARYKGHCGNTWVWVMPEDSEAFAQFTLVLQDIATLDPTIIISPPLLVQLTDYEVTNMPDLTNTDPVKKKFVTIGTSEPLRAVKLQYRKIIEAAMLEGINTGKVNLTRAQWIAYTEPWCGVIGVQGGTPATTLPSPAATGIRLLPATASPGPGCLQPSPTFSNEE